MGLLSSSSAAESFDSTMFAPGDLLAGKYRIERMLAEGGMGILFEATHLQLEEPVAIKFLRPEIAASAETEAAQRFLREARSSIKIRSEHVVRILDVAELESGVPYIVMEMLTGEDLDQLLTKSGALQPSDAIDYVLQACEALAEAHQRGIVHRDLKPANLFLARRADGSPCIKLLDFGISKVSAPGGADLGITNTQAIMGSPRYMSPEQLRASKDVDARSDIWALGIVLYELLTGAPPFDGDTMTAVCAAILQDEPAPMTAARPAIPSALEAVVFKAMAKDPARRFASVADLAVALHPFASASGQTSVSRVTGTMRQPSSPSLGNTTEQTAHAPNAPAAVTAEGSQPAVLLTSTTWGDVPAKPRSRKGAVAIAAGAAVITLVLTVSAIAFYARAKTGRATATGNAVVQSDPPMRASEAPSVAAPVLPEAPVASASAAPDNVQTATNKPPAKTGGPKPPSRTAATASADTRAPPPVPAATAPVATASAPTLWNGRK